MTRIVGSITALLIACACLASAPARAQDGCKYIAYDAVLTAEQWNWCFESKQNTLGYQPVNRAGDIMLGKLTTIASQTSGAGFNLPQGQPPANPQNGDVWTTLDGMFVRINTQTIGPLVGASAVSFDAIEPLAVTHAAGKVTYSIILDPNFSVVAGELALAAGGVAYPSTVTGGAKGAGTINASSLYVDGVAVTGGGITALTGDVSATGPGSVIATLATVNPNVGSFGSSTMIPSITVNAKGLVTAASQSAVIAPAGTLTGSTLAAGVTSSSLTSVGTLTGGATGTGFTVALGTSTITGNLPVANAPSVAADSLLMNNTGGAAVVVAVAVPTCSAALTYSGGAFGCNSGAGTGSVTSVAAGTGMNFTTITTTGTVAIDKASTSDIWSGASNKTLTSDNVFNAAGAMVSLSGTSSVTPDLSTGFNFTFTATSATNYTLNNPTNAKIGQTGCVYLVQPASGTVVTISYGSNWKSAGGASGKSLTATLGAVDRLCYLVRTTSFVDFTMANNIN